MVDGAPAAAGAAGAAGLSPAELRSVEVREAFRGADPNELEAAIERWARVIERGGRLDPGELAGTTFRRRFRGYHHGDVADLIARLVLENT